MKVTLFIMKSDNIANDSILVIPTNNFTGNLTNETYVRMPISGLCLPVLGIQQKEATSRYIFDNFQNYFTSNFDVYIRKSAFSCVDGTSQILLRGNNKESISEIVRIYVASRLSKSISHFVSTNIRDSIGIGVYIDLDTWIDVQSATIFQEVYVPFQG